MLLCYLYCDILQWLCWLQACDYACIPVRACHSDHCWNPNQSNATLYHNPPKSLLFHRIMRTCVKRLGWQMTASASFCKNPTLLSRDSSGYLSPCTQLNNMSLAQCWFKRACQIDDNHPSRGQQEIGMMGILHSSGH